MMEFLKYPKGFGPRKDKLYEKILKSARLKGYSKLTLEFEITVQTNAALEKQFIALFGDLFYSALDTSLKSRLTLNCGKIEEYDFFFSKSNSHILNIFDIISIRPCSQIVFEYVLQKCASLDSSKIPFKIMTFSMEYEAPSQEILFTNIEITYEQARLLKRKNIFPELLYSDLEPTCDEAKIIFAHNILTKFYWKNVILSSGYQPINSMHNTFTSFRILDPQEKLNLLKRLIGETLES